MEETVSSTDTHRNSSGIRPGEREGHRDVITSRDQPFARIVPVANQESVDSGTHAALLPRLERQPVVDVGGWTREELYEDES